MPVSFPGLRCVKAAGNNYDASSFLMYKYITVIAFIRQNEFAVLVELSSRGGAIQISFRLPQGSKKRNGFQSLSIAAWTFVVTSLFRLGFFRASPFGSAGMLVDFDCRAIQHQCCLIHHVLFNQS